MLAMADRTTAGGCSRARDRTGAPKPAAFAWWGWAKYHEKKFGKKPGRQWALSPFFADLFLGT